jgi:hypothetical protein
VGSVDGDPLVCNGNGLPCYTLLWEGSVCASESRMVRWYCQPACLQDFDADVRKELESHNPVLITATLRQQGIEARAPLILEMLEARPAGVETVVMPCENKVPDAWRQIEAACQAKGVIYLRPLVNRISVPVLNLPPGVRETRTHELGEWLVASPQRSSTILEALSVNADFGIVDDLEMRLVRKLYIVNGAHLTLGVRGALLGWDSLRATARLPENAYDIGQLHERMHIGLAHAGCNLADTRDYGRDHLIAYCEVADEVKRIMEPMKRADLRPFLKTVEERLSSPARMTAAAQSHLDSEQRLGDWLAPYRDVFDRFDEVFERLPAFSDGRIEDRSELRLDPAVDREVVSLYERCLRGWERTSDINRRAERLRYNLAMHRVALGGK